MLAGDSHGASSFALASELGERFGKTRVLEILAKFFLYLLFKTALLQQTRGEGEKLV